MGFFKNLIKSAIGSVLEDIGVDKDKLDAAETAVDVAGKVKDFAGSRNRNTIEDMDVPPVPGADYDVPPVPGADFAVPPVPGADFAVPPVPGATPGMPPVPGSDDFDVNDDIDDDIFDDDIDEDDLEDELEEELENEEYESDEDLAELGERVDSILQRNEGVVYDNELAELHQQAVGCGLTVEEFDAQLNARIDELKAAIEAGYAPREVYRTRSVWRRCPNCGWLNYVDDVYCEWCGYQLRHRVATFLLASLMYNGAHGNARKLRRRSVRKSASRARDGREKRRLNKAKGIKPTRKPAAAGKKPLFGGSKSSLKPATPAKKSSLFGSKPAAAAPAKKSSLFGSKPAAAPAKKSSLFGGSSKPKKSSGGGLFKAASKGLGKRRR